jgi:hypothetical protein
MSHSVTKPARNRSISPQKHRTCTPHMYRAGCKRPHWGWEDLKMRRLKNVSNLKTCFVTAACCPPPQAPNRSPGPLWGWWRRGGAIHAWDAEPHPRRWKETWSSIQAERVGRRAGTMHTVRFMAPCSHEGIHGMQGDVQYLDQSDNVCIAIIMCWNPCIIVFFFSLWMLGLCRDWNTCVCAGARCTSRTRRAGSNPPKPMTCIFLFSWRQQGRT